MFTRIIIITFYIITRFTVSNAKIFKVDSVTLNTAQIVGSRRVFNTLLYQGMFIN